MCKVYWMELTTSPKLTFSHTCQWWASLRNPTPVRKKSWKHLIKMMINLLFYSDSSTLNTYNIWEIKQKFDLNKIGQDSFELFVWLWIVLFFLIHTILFKKLPGNFTHQNLFLLTFMSVKFGPCCADNTVYKPLNHVPQNVSVFVAISRTQDKKHKRLGAGVFPFSHTSWGL